MYDCKIPETAESRDVDIKKYIEKLKKIENDFEGAQKQINLLEDATDQQIEEIEELYSEIESDLKEFNNKKTQF